jgi:hypothetical protein
MASSALHNATRSIIEWGIKNGKAPVDRPKATDIYGSLTFGEEAQRRRLPRDVQAGRRCARRRRRRVGRHHRVGAKD